MCEPVTILTGLAIASSVIGGVSASQQASSQRKALGGQRAVQAQEISAQNSLEAGERVKQARAERSRLQVAAGEAGVSGVSFNDQLFDSALQENLDLGALAKNQEFADRASEARYRSGRAGSQGPSALEIGLNTAVAGYSGYSAGLQIKKGK